MSSIANRAELDRLFSVAYEEMRRLARSVLRSDRGAQITPTTLVNEAWLKLSRSPEVVETSALHFRRIAGRAMRQILVDIARRRQALVHGGGQVEVVFDEAVAGTVTYRDRDLLALDIALERLHKLSPRQAELVEARFFGGFSCAACAEMLDVSEATVMREWRAARAWLASEVRKILRMDEE